MYELPPYAAHLSPAELATLTIPLAHVVRAEGADERARQWLKGIRLGGTHVPGALSAGTFYQYGERLFWDVHRPVNAIAISLKDEHYTALIVEVADPVATIAAVNGAEQEVGA